MAQGHATLNQTQAGRSLNEGVFHIHKKKKNFASQRGSPKIPFTLASSRILQSALWGSAVSTSTALLHAFATNWKHCQKHYTAPPKLEYKKRHVTSLPTQLKAVHLEQHVLDASAVPKGSNTNESIKRTDQSVLIEKKKNRTPSRDNRWGRNACARATERRIVKGRSMEGQGVAKLTHQNQAIDWPRQHAPRITRAWVSQNKRRVQLTDYGDGEKRCGRE